MKFTVKRSEWLHGEGAMKSYLVRQVDYKKCCLGFLGEACGLNPGQMVGVKAPSSDALFEMRPKFPTLLFDDDDARCESIVGQELMETNDSRNLSDSERESKLTDLFKKIGIEVIFED